MRWSVSSSRANRACSRPATSVANAVWLGGDDAALEREAELGQGRIAARQRVADRERARAAQRGAVGRARRSRSSRRGQASGASAAALQYGSSGASHMGTAAVGSSHSPVHSPSHGALAQRAALRPCTSRRTDPRTSRRRPDTRRRRCPCTCLRTAQARRARSGTRRCSCRRTRPLRPSRGSRAPRRRRTRTRLPSAGTAPRTGAAAPPSTSPDRTPTARATPARGAGRSRVRRAAARGRPRCSPRPRLRALSASVAASLVIGSESAAARSVRTSVTPLSSADTDAANTRTASRCASSERSPDSADTRHRHVAARQLLEQFDAAEVLVARVALAGLAAVDHDLARAHRADRRRPRAPPLR